jgi:phosphoribosylanthranilate isomerase
MPFNYVSVSAVSDKYQLARINAIYQKEKFSFPLVIGYQVSNKSINQGVNNSRQPPFKKLGDLNKRTRDYGFITAIHYYTKDAQTILGDLEKIVNSGVHPMVSPLQLNTLPLQPNLLIEIKRMGFPIIFKVAVSNKQSPEGGYAIWKGENVQDVSNGEISPLISQVDERKSIIDYVMFDPSHGTNLELNLDEDSLAVKFGKGIVENKKLNHLGLVYAGGIKPTNVGALTKSLNFFFPERVSIDTESGVRTNDKLDLELVKNYLLEYSKVMKKTGMK